MKTKIMLIVLALIGLAASCRYFLDHSFRQHYRDYNSFIHRDTSEVSYLKVHLRDGGVAVLDRWQLNVPEDSLLGEGRSYNFNRLQLAEGRLSYALDDIAILETNSNEVASKDAGRIAALTIITAIDAIGAIVCLTVPKACFGSCPTWYVEGGTEVVAESFSQSITPSLASSDIDAIRLRTAQRRLRLRMTNESLETHVLDEVQLLAVPVGEKEQIYHDRHGAFYRCEQAIQPTRANAPEGDCRSALIREDGQERFSPTAPENLGAREVLNLDFSGLSHGEYGLVLTFRQTLVTTFILYTGLDYMGEEVGDYFASVERSPVVRRHLSKPFARLGTIDIYYRHEPSGEWKLADQLYETGPIARNRQFAVLPQEAIHDGKARLRIDLARGNWRLDYAAMAPILEKIEPSVHYPVSARSITSPGPDERESILAEDESSIVTFRGDAYDFVFELPHTGQSFELFLNARGYYLEWMRPDWLREKEPEKLHRLLSNDETLWTELAREYKASEAEMEEMFWNSKYEPIIQ